MIPINCFGSLLGRFGLRFSFPPISGRFGFQPNRVQHSPIQCHQISASFAADYFFLSVFFSEVRFGFKPNLPAWGKFGFKPNLPGWGLRGDSIGFLGFQCFRVESGSVLNRTYRSWGKFGFQPNLPGLGFERGFNRFFDFSMFSGGIWLGSRQTQSGRLWYDKSPYS